MRRLLRLDGIGPWLPAATLILTAGPLLALSALGEEAGTMVEVVNRVTGAPADGQPTALAVADAVLLDMTVATERASYAAMTLGENGSLQIGPETQVVVDRATIDQATGASESLLSVLVGKIRLALSSSFRGSVDIDTPTATIGIKGTTLAVQVDARGDTLVWVVEGVVEVRSKAGGKTLLLTAGHFTAVARGAPPTGPTPFDEETGIASVRVLPAILFPPEPEDRPPTVPLIDALAPRREDGGSDGFPNPTRMNPRPPSVPG